MSGIDAWFMNGVIEILNRHVAGEEFSMKELSGEVANIFSYFEFLEQNEDVSRIIQEPGPAILISNSTNVNWWQKFNEFNGNGSLASNEIGLAIGASIEGYGLKIGVNSNYSREEVSTHKTTVSDLIKLKVHFDNLDPIIGETDYRVRPYSYWSKKGALVINYRVAPEISAPGGTNTWWQDNYQEYSDPSFILPWKFDPEKGITIGDPDKRFQMKEITFDPVEAGPGDIVTLNARIHNFKEFYLEMSKKNSMTSNNVKLIYR